MSSSFDQSGSSGSCVSSKDIDMIVDSMNHEALAYKKCSVYASYFVDETLKDIANRAAKHHKEHFDVLEQFLTSQQ